MVMVEELEEEEDDDDDLRTVGMGTLPSCFSVDNWKLNYHV
jgi:hypothetical protein